ncbi:MAG: hypothetical protein R2710_11920 [Acidimicrobiales bacterium]
MILGGTNNTADGSGDLTGLSRAELHERMLAAEIAARQAKADYYELCAEAKRRKSPSIHQHRNEALWLADLTPHGQRRRRRNAQPRLAHVHHASRTR